MRGEGNQVKGEMETASEEKTSKPNTQNRKRKSERIEGRERNKRREEEQRKAKEKQKTQITEEMKEVQKEAEDKGRHRYGLRYKYCSSSRFKVEDTQPD